MNPNNLVSAWKAEEEIAYIRVLEKMDKFFEARLDGYEEHMLNNIEGVGELGSNLLPESKQIRRGTKMFIGSVIL